MIPNEKFKFEPAVKDGRKVVVLKGVIDEDTNFEGIKKLGNPLVFNFRHLAAINSCGIRTWVNFLKELGHVQIAYEECPPLVVRQMNMVPSFVGHATVTSVFVPYVCESCEKEKLVLVGSNDFAKVPETAGTCASCENGEMELDGHPQQYFAFAR